VLTTGFTAYNNGKSAVRLNRHWAPPLPYGVHGFLDDNMRFMEEYEQVNDNSGPVVLHYPNASFSQWLKKYKMLGDFPLKKDGQINNMRCHVASREICKSKDRKKQELFYKTYMMQNEYGEHAYLAEHGLIQRIPTVPQIMHYLDNQAANPEEEPEILPGQQKYVLPNGLQVGG